MNRFAWDVWGVRLRRGKGEFLDNYCIRNLITQEVIDAAPKILILLGY